MNALTVTPTVGQTVVVPYRIVLLILTLTSDIRFLTIELPLFPVDGQMFVVKAPGQFGIMTLTMASQDGTTVQQSFRFPAVGGPIEHVWSFSAVTATWVQLG